MVVFITYLKKNELSTNNEKNSSFRMYRLKTIGKEKENNTKNILVENCNYS